MSTRATGARFRQRKLNPKHNLQVLHEDDVGDLFGDENDASRHIPKVATGVEETEETEHHLQAVISASAAASLGGKVAQIYIPTPEAKSSAIKYDDLYPKCFASPTTYIRFSSTVEDCIGPPYCMDEEDEAFLKSLNDDKTNDAKPKTAKDGDSTHATASKCSEQVFEILMSFFEEIAQMRQPYAAVDSPPVLSLQELKSSYDETVTPEAREWTDKVYPHWRKRRLAGNNTVPLLPSLKGETGQESDETDAYVCFRRREVRTARKTRGRDAQVVEKLKKLRRELEEARLLVHMINQREKLYVDRIEIDRKVFEQRSELKRVKIDQGIKGDDLDLLVTQKPAPKPKAPKIEAPPRPATLRLSTSRADLRQQPDNDLVQLSDVQAQRASAIEQYVQDKITRHCERNRDFLDETWDPITPPVLDFNRTRAGLMPFVEEVPAQEIPLQMSTPPASVKDVEMDDVLPVVEANKVAVVAKDGPEGNDLPTPVSDQDGRDEQSKMLYRLASPPPEPQTHMPAYRRRYGRNGILHIEEYRSRQALPAKRCNVVYDSDEAEDDGDAVVYPVDYYSNWNMNYRSSLLNMRSRSDSVDSVARRPSALSTDLTSATTAAPAPALKQQPAVPNIQAPTPS